MEQKIRDIGDVRTRIGSLDRSITEVATG